MLLPLVEIPIQSLSSLLRTPAPFLCQFLAPSITTVCSNRQRRCWAMESITPVNPCSPLRFTWRRSMAHVISLRRHFLSTREPCYQLLMLHTRRTLIIFPRLVLKRGYELP